MGVTPGNLIQGVGTFYTGVFSATAANEPATVNTTPAASAWSDRGGTLDGVELTVAQEFKDLEVDQLIDTPETRRTKRDIGIKTNLAEITLDNLAAAMNESTPASAVGGARSFEPTEDITAVQPGYIALIFDGLAPGGYRRRALCRKALQTADITLAYKKDDQQVLSCEWRTFYVSSTVKRFKIVDQTA